MNRILKDTPLCAIDFETTGLDKDNSDRAIEIALVRQEPDGSIHAWSSLLKTPKAISPKSQKIHNITEEMIKSAPTFEEVYPQIDHFIQGSILVAHHSPFDMNFLQKECLLAQKSVPDHIGVIDTLKMARNILSLPRNSLSALCNRIGIIPHHAHRAIYDAQNALFLLQTMLSSFGLHQLNLAELQEFCTLHRRPSGSKHKEVGISLQKAVRNKNDIVISYISSAPNRPLIQRRHISPQKIRDHRIHGFCHLRQEKRSFQIARIHAVEELPQTLQSPADSIS